MKAKYRTEIIGYETTPYCKKQVEGGWVVYQSWWGKDVSPVFATMAEANDELVRIAKENRAYKAIRRKIKIEEAL